MILRVNGKGYAIDVDAQTPLLWVLRDHLGLCGTKFSCGIGMCGSCTVLLEGKPSRSCILPISDVGDREVITIEGLQGHIVEKLKQAWIAEDVPQCGYCQPGQIMNAAALLTTNPRPTGKEIDSAMSRVLCRCGTYLSIRRAITKVVEDIS